MNEQDTLAHYRTVLDGLRDVHAHIGKAIAHLEAVDKPGVPDFDWVRLDELRVNDRIQGHSRSPSSDAWLSVTHITKPYESLGDWRIYCAEKAGLYVFGKANTQVRRIVEASGGGEVADGSQASSPTPTGAPMSWDELDAARTLERDEQLQAAEEVAS